MINENKPSKQNGEIAFVKTLKKEHTRLVRSLALSEKDNILFTGSEDYTIKIWKASKVKGDYAYVYSLEGHTNRVNSLAWSEEESTLFSASENCTIKIWKVSKDNRELVCV